MREVSIATTTWKKVERKRTKRIKGEENKGEKKEG